MKTIIMEEEIQLTKIIQDENPQKDFQFSETKTLKALGLSEESWYSFINKLETKLEVQLPSNKRLEEMTLSQLADFIIENSLVTKQVQLILIDLLNRLFEIQLTPELVSAPIKSLDMDSLDFIVYKIELEQAINVRYGCYIYLNAKNISATMSWKQLGELIVAKIINSRI